MWASASDWISKYVLRETICMCDIIIIDIKRMSVLELSTSMSVTFVLEQLTLSCCRMILWNDFFFEVLKLDVQEARKNRFKLWRCMKKMKGIFFPWPEKPPEKFVLRSKRRQTLTEETPLARSRSNFTLKQPDAHTLLGNFHLPAHHSHHCHPRSPSQEHQERKKSCAIIGSLLCIEKKNSLEGERKYLMPLPN